jgi:hypothetical protein
VIRADAILHDDDVDLGALEQTAVDFRNGLRWKSAG